jgi:hypothetical protein
MTASTIFKSLDGRALYYSSGDTIFELGAGRPVFYRGVDSGTIYTFDGVPTFWIDTSQEAGAELLPFSGTKGHLFRYDGGSPLYFEPDEAAAETVFEVGET